ncbi:RNA polymerase sigma factor [Actinoallomurus acanthiterrae]
MDGDVRPGPETVVAARDGDQAALDWLIAGYLPLVYNIVGRALDGHADVDDVVQETMLRVVHGLEGLRDPDGFRSWLVAIAMRQVRDHWRRGRTAPAGGLDGMDDVADPGADFADLTILRLGLSGQRREVAEATRWLGPEDRELLSLWWLEAAGELTRAELAAALDLPPAHAAVRVQRMKAQLETARAVVRALHATPRCPGLAELTASWDGVPDPVWRKRLARHARDCTACGAGWSGLVPAERLLTGLALVPLPAGSPCTGRRPPAATPHRPEAMPGLVEAMPGRAEPRPGPEAMPERAEDTRRAGRRRVRRRRADRAAPAFTVPWSGPGGSAERWVTSPPNRSPWRRGRRWSPGGPPLPRPPTPGTPPPSARRRPSARSRPDRSRFRPPCAAHPRTRGARGPHGGARSPGRCTAATSTRWTAPRRRTRPQAGYRSVPKGGRWSSPASGSSPSAARWAAGTSCSTATTI